MEEKKLPHNVELAEEKKKVTTKKKKKLFLSALSRRMLNVSKACEVVGISRNTVYRWRDEDDTFKNEWDSIVEAFYDDIETVMFSKATIEKDTTMLIWLSKTKMRHRGYIEKVENEVNINAFEKLMQELEDDE